MDVWNFVDSWCLTANLSWVKFLFQMNLLHSLRLGSIVLGGLTLRFVSAAAKIDDFTRPLRGPNTPFQWLYRFPMLRKWHSKNSLVTHTTLPCQSLDSLPQKSSSVQMEENYGKIRTNWYGKIDNNGLSGASEWVPLDLFSWMTPDASRCLLSS